MTYKYFIIMVATILLLLLILRKNSHISKNALYLGWKILLIRILIPFQISIPSKASIYNLIESKLPLETIEVVKSDYITDLSKWSQINWMDILHSMQVIGFIFFCLYAVIIFVKSRELIKKAIVINNDTSLWLETHKCKQKLHIISSKNIVSPMACNFIKSAYILLPEGFIFNQNSKPIMEHEFTHIKSFDSYWKLFALLALCIHWFNPFIWVFYFYFYKEIELACDEKVLDCFGHSHRASYAHELLNYASVDRDSTFFSSFKTNQFIKERLISIMKYKQNTKAKILFSFSLISVLLLLFVTNPVIAALEVSTHIVDQYTSTTLKENENKSENKNQEIFLKAFQMKIEQGIINNTHTIPIESVFIYQSNVWKFKEGTKAKMTLQLTNRDFSESQQLEFGYILNNKMVPVLKEQLSNGVSLDFILPENGEYQFYLICRSSDTLVVEYFKVS